MERYRRAVECVIKGCSGIVSTYWDSKNGFKNARCPVCMTLFEPYIETALRLMKIEKPNKQEE